MKYPPIFFLRPQKKKTTPVLFLISMCTLGTGISVFGNRVKNLVRIDTSKLLTKINMQQPFPLSKFSLTLCYHCLDLRMVRVFFVSRLHRTSNSKPLTYSDMQFYIPDTRLTLLCLIVKNKFFYTQSRLLWPPPCLRIFAQNRPFCAFSYMNCLKPHHFHLILTTPTPSLIAVLTTQGKIGSNQEWRCPIITNYRNFWIKEQF